MQDQLDSKRAETAAIKNVVDKAKRAIEGLGSMEIPSAELKEVEHSQLLSVPSTANGMHGATGIHSSKERENAVWPLADADFA